MVVEKKIGIQLTGVWRAVCEIDEVAGLRRNVSEVKYSQGLT